MSFTDRGRAARAQAGSPRRTCCAGCRHFCNDPRLLEQHIAGFRVLGSGWSAARDSDGLCELWQRYLSRHSRCARFEAA